MDPYSAVIGSNLLFARKGDAFVSGKDSTGAVINNGTVGLNALPDVVDGGGNILAPWLDMGALESFDPSVSQKDIKLWRPKPGRAVIKDMKETQLEFNVKAVTNDISSLVFELFFRTLQKLSGAQKFFNPLSSLSKYGFIHWQAYDDTDQLVVTMDCWGKLRCSSKFPLTDAAKPEWDFFGLDSNLNSGELGA